jgi:hypothetical protein
MVSSRDGVCSRHGFEFAAVIGTIPADLAAAGIACQRPFRVKRNLSLSRGLGYIFARCRGASVAAKTNNDGRQRVEGR